MSLAIDIDRVTAVLLADGWHEVADDSFLIDAYEYLWEGEPSYLAGESQHIATTGFQFKCGQFGTISGPLTSILAVRTRRR